MRRNRDVRFGSKADIGGTSASCPLYPQKRTSEPVRVSPSMQYSGSFAIFAAIWGNLVAKTLCSGRAARWRVINRGHAPPRQSPVLSIAQAGAGAPGRAQRRPAAPGHGRAASMASPRGMSHCCDILLLGSIKQGIGANYQFGSAVPCYHFAPSFLAPALYELSQFIEQ